MTGFSLSPGITPLITEVAIICFALSLGLSAIFSRARFTTFYLAIGLNALTLSLLKIYTDYFDFWDAFLGLMIAVESVVLMAMQLRESNVRRRYEWVMAITLVLVVLSLSTYKILSDFYDPNDVLLSCSGILAGVAILAVGDTIK